MRQCYTRPRCSLSLRAVRSNRCCYVICLHGKMELGTGTERPPSSPATLVPGFLGTGVVASSQHAVQTGTSLCSCLQRKTSETSLPCDLFEDWKKSHHVPLVLASLILSWVTAMITEVHITGRRSLSYLCVWVFIHM